MDLRHFVTKQDIEKIPDVFPLKPIFEIAYSDAVKPALSVLSTDSSDYAEPIWKMTSGKNNIRQITEANGFKDTVTGSTDLLISKKKADRRLADSADSELFTQPRSKDQPQMRLNRPPNPPLRTISTENGHPNNVRPHLPSTVKTRQNYAPYLENKDANFTLPV